MGIQNVIPKAAFHGIFEYLSNNILIFGPKISEYSYSVNLIITNILVFIFGQKCDPEYIHIHILFKKNIPCLSYTSLRWVTILRLSGELPRVGGGPSYRWYVTIYGNCHMVLVLRVKCRPNSEFVVHFFLVGDHPRDGR